MVMALETEKNSTKEFLYTFYIVVFHDVIIFYTMS